MRCKYFTLIMSTAKLLGWLNSTEDCATNGSEDAALKEENNRLRIRVSQLERELEILKRPKQRRNTETQTACGEEPAKEEATGIYALEMPAVSEKYKKTKFNFGTAKVFETKMITTGNAMSDFELLNYVAPKNTFQKYLIPANPASRKKFIRRVLAEDPVLDYTSYPGEVTPATLSGYKVRIYQRDLTDKSWKKYANGYTVINDKVVNVVSSVGSFITEVEISSKNIHVMKDGQGVTCLGKYNEYLTIFFLKFKDRESFTSFVDKTRHMMKITN